MNRRYLKRRYRRKSGPALPRSRRERSPGPCPDGDAECFEALVQARVVALLGAPLDVVARDPDLRQAVYDAVAKGLREPPRPIPPHIQREVDRLNAAGLRVTAGTGDFPVPLDLGGWSLSQAIIEDRRWPD